MASGLVSAPSGSASWKMRECAWSATLASNKRSLRPKLWVDFQVSPSL